MISTRARLGAGVFVFGVAYLLWSRPCLEASVRSKVPYYGLDLDMYWNSVLCEKLMRFGAAGDGGWVVCNDGRAAIGPQSLVLSFGIRDDDSFDRHINAATQAEVYMFDPTEFVSIDRAQHTKAMVFHAWGLAAADNEGGKFPYLTLRTIRHRLKIPQDRIVDVLKVDIEHNEWASLLQACTAGDLRLVRQIAVEFHLWPGDRPHQQYFAEQREVVRCLGKAGFRFIFLSENGASEYLRGANNQKLRQCFETTAINVNLLQSLPPPQPLS